MKDKKTIELANSNNLGYVLGGTFLVEPIFEETGFVEVVFPKGAQWIYFFNHSRIFPGGTTSNLGIKLDETALFIKSNSVFPFAHQLWLVHLEEGTHTKTILRGNHSDQVTIAFKDSRLNITVERHFKDEAVKNSLLSDRTLTIKLIGDSAIALNSGREPRKNTK